MLQKPDNIEGEQHPRLIEIISHIGTVLTASLNPGDVFIRVMDIIREYFAAQYWSLLLIDEKNNRLKFEIVMGVNKIKLKEVYIDRSEGIVGWVCANGKPLVVKDVQKDPRFTSKVDKVLGFTTQSVVCVPLLNGSNQVIGAIELINKLKPDYSDTEKNIKGDPLQISFTEADMMILSSIGAFTGIAAENAFLHEKVKELAMIDSLTGVYNRHYFNEAFARETERALRYKQRFCLLMIDIDKFKEINDKFGHLKGDVVLQEIAKILNSSIRESDTVARYGGDEFVIIMPHSNTLNGENLATRIQEQISRWNNNNNLPGIKLSVSIGVEDTNAENADELLNKADQKMYDNKILRKRAEDITSESEMRRYLLGNIVQD